MQRLTAWTVCIVASLLASAAETGETSRPAPKRFFAPRNAAAVTQAASQEPATETVNTVNTVKWAPNPEWALQRSQETGQPMLLVFGGKRCGWCRKLEKETLADPQVVKLVNGEFVAIHLDVEQHPKIAEALEVEGLPTTVVLTAEGDVLATAEGFQPAGRFRKTLKQALVRRSERDEAGVQTVSGEKPLEVPARKR